MHDVSRLAIYRQLQRASKRQRSEAMTIFPFFIRLQGFIHVTDVDYGPDPPDFVVRSERSRVGVELTSLTREGGADSMQWKFGKWEKEIKKRPQRLDIFKWGEYTLRQVLDVFRGRLAEKTAKAAARSGRYDENWLIFNIGEGGPCGGWIEANFTPVEKLRKAAHDCAGKFLYETKLICKEPHPFGRIILSSGIYFLTFRGPLSQFKLPLANPALLDHGATVAKAVLEPNASSFLGSSAL